MLHESDKGRGEEKGEKNKNAYILEAKNIKDRQKAYKEK